MGRDKRLRFHSVNFILTIALVFVTTLLLFTFSYFNYSERSATASAELDQNAKLVATRLSKSLVKAVWNMDTNQTREVLLSELGEKNVKSITIREPNKTSIFVALGRDKDGKPVEFTEQTAPEAGDTVATANVNREGEPIGTVEVTLTHKFIQEELRRMMWTSVIGTLTIDLAVVLILFAVISILVIRPLAKSVAFAESMARGDLTKTIDIKREDEVGQLAASLNAMSQSFRSMVEMISTMADLASRGFLRKTLNTSGFAGDYLNMMEKINTWSNNLVMVIDAMPPVMIRDKDRHMRFLNRAGSLGIVNVNEIEGKLCSEHYKKEDCEKDVCACDRALSNRQATEAKTVARPKPELLLEIEYKAIPFGEDAILECVIDQTAILKVQKQIVEVAQKSEKIAEAVSSASQEISNQIEQSSRGAEEQSRRVSEIASAMDEMNATVLEVAKNATEAADISEDAKSKAKEGESLVVEVVAGIHQVQRQALQLKQDMGTLGKQVDDIGKIMNVISDIADQTNLLALNAAIEAARAGDAGRGFAVVADEVRKLAEKTMTATKEVGDSINVIQHGAKMNIENVDRAVNAIENATALTKRSGDSLKVIVNLVEQTSDQIHSIATASDEQSSASEEINHSVEQVATISSQTAQAMSLASQGVMELAKQFRVLQCLITEMMSGAASHVTYSS